MNARVAGSPQRFALALIALLTLLARPARRTIHAGRLSAGHHRPAPHATGAYGRGRDRRAIPLATLRAAGARRRRDGRLGRGPRGPAGGDGSHPARGRHRILARPALAVRSRVPRHAWLRQAPALHDRAAVLRSHGSAVRVRRMRPVRAQSYVALPAAAPEAKAKASPTVPSWNQIMAWLRELNMLRNADAA